MRFFLPSVSAAALILCAGAVPLHAQMSDSDIIIRLEQIENQMRTLTGNIEQLQYRNQQLEQQVRRLQEGGGGAPAQAAQPLPSRGPQPPMQSAPMQTAPMQEPTPIRPVAPAMPGRRGDVFDPNADPNAPGAPRPLGALPAGQPSAPLIAEEEPVGPRGGREPGSPLDLSSVNGAPPQGQPPRGQNPALAAVAPPSQSPRDQLDLGYGYIQRKDYALAEQTFRDFLQRYPGNSLSGEAQYWLGESLFQRQRYRDAADAFLTISTKYETAAKAPDALLRLAQSLGAMNEKEAACAALGEVNRKYPRASTAVKQAVDREQKRARC